MANPIRILCVFSTLDRGGAESMCMNLYRHIDREKIQFDFVKHTSKKGLFEDEIVSLGGRVFTAPRFEIYNIIQYRLWWKKHLQLHPEHHIIHGHFFTISSVYFQIAKQMDRITVAHSHCTKAPKEAEKNPVKALIKNYLISRIEDYADYCLACSNAAAQWVFQKKGYTVLNNAIDTRKFQYNEEIAYQVRRELKLGDEFVIGTVGRFNLQKNPMGIVEIFRLLHDSRPDSKLLWIGDGPMRREALLKVCEYGLEQNVLFLGVRDDVNRLLQSMDAFIFPSFYEGLGVALIEAQAAGVKCFCSEAVPKEAMVTPLCSALPLSDYVVWRDKLLMLDNNKPHENYASEIIESGFDIHTTAEWLTVFYSSIC